MGERLTVLDDDGAPVGTADRDTVHRQGLWHEVFHCLVVRTAVPPRVVLQRRRLGARGFPGLIDLSVTGHLAAGEAPLDGRRELREELGIDVSPAALVPLGRRRLVDVSGSGGGTDARAEGWNREIVHAFLLADDRRLDAFPVDHDHIAGLVELEAGDLRALLAGERDHVTTIEWDGVELRRIDLSVGHLVPDVGGYWLALLDAACAVLAGADPPTLDGGSPPPA